MKARISKLGAMAIIGVLIALFLLACDSQTQPPGQNKPEKDPSSAVPDEKELLAKGKKGWRSCATCHCATDSRITEDKDWVLLNEETT